LVRHTVVGVLPEPVADKVVALPRHIVDGVAKGATVNVGDGLTLTEPVTELVQPVTRSVTLYVTITDPVATPVTTPLELTVATLALSVDHVPPEGDEDKVMLLPTHTLSGLGVMADTVGAGFTVTIAVTLDALQPFGAWAIIVNVDVCTVVVKFVKAPVNVPVVTVPPGPVAFTPARLVVFVRCQLYAVFATVLENVIVKVFPEQIVEGDIEILVVGVWLTVIVPFNDGLLQEEPVVVTV
jgi:hypothetical protein